MHQRIEINKKTTELEIKIDNKAIILFKDELDALLSKSINIVPDHPVLIMKYPTFTKFQKWFLKLWAPLFGVWVLMFWILVYKHVPDDTAIAVGLISMGVFALMNIYYTKLINMPPISIAKKPYNFLRRPLKTR